MNENHEDCIHVVRSCDDHTSASDLTTYPTYRTGHQQHALTVVR